MEKFKIIALIIITYFLSYFSVFGSIIDDKFITIEFITYFIINFIIFIFLINSNIFKQFIKSKLNIFLIFIFSISSHIVSRILGEFLGPTIIQLRYGDLSKTNEILILFNIIFLLTLLFSLIVINYFRFKKDFKNNFISIIILYTIIIINRILFPILNFIIFVYVIS